MKPLELRNRHVPAGAIVSPVRICIVAQVRAHDERTTAQLADALLAAKLVTPEELAAKSDWLQNHLAKLREAKHIFKAINAAQQLVWVSVDPEPAPPRSVAAPRRVDVLHGPTYVAPAMAPARPGAMDFARAPSLQGNRRVAFWGTT